MKNDVKCIQSSFLSGIPPLIPPLTVACRSPSVQSKKFVLLSCYHVIMITYIAGEEWRFSACQAEIKRNSEDETDESIIACLSAITT